MAPFSVLAARVQAAAAAISAVDRVRTAAARLILPGRANPLAECAARQGRTFQNVFEAVSSATFTVLVVGRFKAGKSTALNAFLGARVLPAAVQAETAVSVDLVHVPNSPTPRLRLAAFGDSPEEIVEAADHVLKRLEAINDEARSDSTALARYEGRVSVEAALNVMAGLPANGSRFVFVDVAGQGEAGAQHLGAAASRAIEKANFVLVVMEYTKMNEDEGIAWLKALAQNQADLFSYVPGASLPRLMILLNKVDAHASDDNRSVTPDEAPAFVRASLAQAGLDVPEQCILPFSALNALRARLYLLGQSREEERAELFADEFGPRWADHPAGELRGVAEAVLELTGVLAVEGRIRALYGDTERRLAASAADQLRNGLAALSAAAGQKRMRELLKLEVSSGAVPTESVTILCEVGQSVVILLRPGSPTHIVAVELEDGGPYTDTLSLHAVLGLGAGPTVNLVINCNATFTGARQEDSAALSQLQRTSTDLTYVSLTLGASVGNISAEEYRRAERLSLCAEALLEISAAEQQLAAAITM